MDLDQYFDTSDEHWIFWAMVTVFAIIVILLIGYGTVSWYLTVGSNHTAMIYIGR